MPGYAGSIAATAEIILITSPRRGVAMILGTDGALVATTAGPIRAGQPVPSGTFTVTDGMGAVRQADHAGLTALAGGTPLWDNHLVALS